MLDATSVSRLEDEPDDAAKTQGYTGGFFECNGFFEEDCRHEHGHDGCDRINNRKVDRSGHAYGVKERHLRHNQTEESGTEHS